MFILKEKQMLTNSRNSAKDIAEVITQGDEK
jgi:hypothetical protein